jgi:hypothetical protein
MPCCNDVAFLTFLTNAIEIALFADPVFQLPDAEGGEEERLGSGESSSGGHGMLAVAVAAVAVGAIFRTLIFLRARFGFAHGVVGGGAGR